jgi:acyl-CoA thioesterase-1
MKKFLLLSLLMLSFSLSAAEKIKVACVGDSITAGAGVKDPANRYPTQLGVLLGDDYVVQNFGVSGTTMLDDGDSPYKKKDAYNKALAFVPDIVVIKLGTNDSKPQNMKKIEGFTASTISIVNSFTAANPKVKIYLCYPVPVVGKGNFGINNEAVKDTIIPMIQKVADEKKLAVIDLYKALSGHDELIPDRVHPNDEGATLIAKAVAAAITPKK